MLELFLNWDLKYTGLVTNLGPVPFVPWGTTRRFGKSKTHNEKASTAQDPLGVGVRTITTKPEKIETPNPIIYGAKKGICSHF